MKFNFKKYNTKLIIIIAVITVTVLLTTYAFVTAVTQENTGETAAGCFEVNYDGQSITDALVSTTNYLEGSHYQITLSKNENCDIYTEATIYVHTNEGITAPINDTQALKYKVFREETELADGFVTNENNEDKALTTVALSENPITYDIYIWVDKDISQGEYNGATYSGYIYAASTQSSTIKLKSINAYADEIMIPNSVSDSSIDFNVPSSTSSTNGVYIRSGTQNTTYPIYYYRGNVNNNLIFANTCWKVVRTTDTGGLKLIYNGVPSNGQCNNTGESSQIGTKAFNSTYTSPAHVGYMYGTPYNRSTKSMSSDTTAYVYGNSVSYSNGTYTLTDTITSGDWSSIYNGGLNNNHYTCFTTGTTCSSVGYIYYTNSSTAYYITLTNGKKVEDALSEMLDYNTTSSTIKGDKDTAGTIDNWYYNNIELAGYSDYIEDTVWCNDRSIGTLNGWDPNGGNTTAYLYFAAYNRANSTREPSLTCGREIDSFTVSEENGNGDLDYPVGLLIADEVMLAGGRAGTGNSTYYLYSGSNYWAGSPFNFNGTRAYEFTVYSSGSLIHSHVGTTDGVRPSLSLKRGFKLTGDGDGSVSKPYLVE